MAPLRNVTAIVRSLVVLGAVLATEASSARASNLRAQVVVAIERLESIVDTTRWNLNTLEEKRALEAELRILKKLYDRILEHESDFMTLECAGATIDPEGGPPVSTASSDVLGTLLLGENAARAGIGMGGRPTTPASVDGARGGAPFVGLGYRFLFAREITDVEVRLLAQLVYIDDRLQSGRWHLNNLNEQRDLKKIRDRVAAELRRVRNSRC